MFIGGVGGVFAVVRAGEMVAGMIEGEGEMMFVTGELVGGNCTRLQAVIAITNTEPAKIFLIFIRLSMIITE
jgi:hypothetical protein